MNARLIVRRRIGDIETPVGAMLKLGANAPGSFLFESIAGGERLGRYSFIGLEPELWLRIQDGRAELSPSADFSDTVPLPARRWTHCGHSRKWRRHRRMRPCPRWHPAHSAISVMT